jgi:hypothetical protein
MNKANVFQHLRNLNIHRVDVDFSGGGDEGGPEAISITTLDGKTHQISPYSYTKEISQENIITNADVIESLSGPIYEKYGTFAGEFYVNGTLVWDVGARNVYMQGQESNTVYEPFEESY